MYVSGRYRVISFICLSSPSVSYESDGCWLCYYILYYKYVPNMFVPFFINVLQAMIQFLVNSREKQPLCFYFFLKHLTYCDVK
jgi:hypothetical protein